jgi:DNA-binding beta-propeller fold protein YncE
MSSDLVKTQLALRVARLFVCAVASLALLSACAETRYVLDYGVDEKVMPVVPQWPLPPEVPRYRYAGELTGAGNYVEIVDENRSTAEEVLAWIIGLVPKADSPRRMQRPQAGTIDSQGRILVTDTGLGAVFMFDEAEGRFSIWRYASQGVRFDSPVGIANGPDGQVLVADAELGFIARLDANGNPVGRFGEGVLTRPTGVARDPDRGLIYVADTHAHDIKVFDDQGQLVDTLGGRGYRQGQFNYPTHLDYKRGQLYLTDTMNTRIQVLDTEGDVKRTFGERGLLIGDLVRPKGVAADSEGNIYVIESYHDHMLVFNASGQLLLPIGGEGNAPGRFYLPAGVWVDSRDRVFVADTFNGRVQIFQFLGSS